MKNIDKITDFAEWSRAFDKPFGVNSQVFEVLKMQENLSRNLGGLTMASELAREMNRRWSAVDFALNPMTNILDAVTISKNFAVPKSVLDSIAAIDQYQEKILRPIQLMAESYNLHLPVIAQMNDLSFALRNISGHVASLAVKQADWSIIENFEEVTEQALEFTDTLDISIEEETQKRFKTLLSLIIVFCGKHKALGIYSLLLVDIFLRFANAHRYYDFLREKPELATRKDVNLIAKDQDSITYFMQEIHRELKKVDEYRITNRICAIKIKPKRKTEIISKLPKGFELIVLQVHHKWVYVSFFDPKDGLPQTGWIMKKYLNKKNKN